MAATAAAVLRTTAGGAAVVGRWPLPSGERCPCSVAWYAVFKESRFIELWRATVYDSLSPIPRQRPSVSACSRQQRKYSSTGRDAGGTPGLAWPTLFRWSIWKPSRYVPPASNRSTRTTILRRIGEAGHAKLRFRSLSRFRSHHLIFTARGALDISGSKANMYRETSFCSEDEFQSRFLCNALSGQSVF